MPPRFSWLSPGQERFLDGLGAEGRAGEVLPGGCVRIYRPEDGRLVRYTVSIAGHVERKDDLGPVENHSS